MSDTMQPIDEILDDEVLDAADAEAAEAYEEVEEFDPFEGMSDEELDALCDTGTWTQPFLRMSIFTGEIA